MVKYVKVLNKPEASVNINSFQCEEGFLFATDSISAICDALFAFRPLFHIWKENHSFNIQDFLHQIC